MTVEKRTSAWYVGTAVAPAVEAEQTSPALIRPDLDQAVRREGGRHQLDHVGAGAHPGHGGAGAAAGGGRVPGALDLHGVAVLGDPDDVLPGGEEQRGGVGEGDPRPQAQVVRAEGAGPVGRGGRGHRRQLAGQRGRRGGGVGAAEDRDRLGVDRQGPLGRGSARSRPRWGEPT